MNPGALNRMTACLVNNPERVPIAFRPENDNIEVTLIGFKVNTLPMENSNFFARAKET